MMWRKMELVREIMLQARSTFTLPMFHVSRIVGAQYACGNAES